MNIYKNSIENFEYFREARDFILFIFFETVRIFVSLLSLFIFCSFDRNYTIYVVITRRRSTIIIKNHHIISTVN